MARPKLNTQKKIHLNLTVSAEVKEKLEAISQEKNISISQIVENMAIRTYAKLPDASR